MSTALTGTEAKLLEQREGLEPGTLRYEVVDAALSFKSSWIHLAEQLIRVKEKRAFKEWGYRRFQDFCLAELHIRSQTVSKLLHSHRWLSGARPSASLTQDMHDDAGGPTVDVIPPRQLKPIDFDAVHVAVQAEKALSKDRLSEADYVAIKDATLNGVPAVELKKTLRETLKPIELPETLKLERGYRRALDNCLKSLDALMNIDADDTILASGDQFRKDIVAALDALVTDAEQPEDPASDGEAPETETV